MKSWWMYSKDQQFALSLWKIQTNWNIWSAAWKNPSVSFPALSPFSEHLMRLPVLVSTLFRPEPLSPFRSTHSIITKITFPIPRLSNLNDFCRKKAPEDILTPSFHSAPVREIALVYKYLYFGNKYVMITHKTAGQKYALYEEKVILASLLRNFQFLIDPARIPIQPLLDIVLKPSGGLPLMITKRPVL